MLDRNGFSFVILTRLSLTVYIIDWNKPKRMLRKNSFFFLNLYLYLEVEVFFFFYTDAINTFRNFSIDL